MSLFGHCQDSTYENSDDQNAEDTNRDTNRNFPASVMISSTFSWEQIFIGMEEVEGLILAILVPASVWSGCSKVTGMSKNFAWVIDSNETR